MTSWVVLTDDIDSIRVGFSAGFTLAFKLLIAVFLFGVALDTKPDDFRAVARRPWAIGACLVAQYVVMPAATLGLIAVLDVRGSIALGMLFVVCCPAGNISNLLTHRARGDVALSVSLTAVSNTVAIVATPLAFAFWGGLQPDISTLLRDIEIDAGDMAIDVGLLIGLPFALGGFVAYRWPTFTARARGVVEKGTLVLLAAVVGVGVGGRAEELVEHVGAVFAVVVVQNFVSLVVGYLVGRGTGLPIPGVRAMTFELGVRNTALALILVITFFDGLGGAALVVATWALWDVFTGLVLSTWWRSRSGISPDSDTPHRRERATGDRR